MKKIKIDGDSFDRIKEKRAAYEHAGEEASRNVKEKQKELWDAIHEEFPELERETNYTLDAENGDLGFYVVKECDGKQDGFREFLKAMIETK